MWMSGFLTVGPEEGRRIFIRNVVFSVFILVVTMEKVLTYVCEVSDNEKEPEDSRQQAVRVA
jgi:hypothetical protein